MAKKKSKKRTQKNKKTIKYEFIGILVLTLMLIEIADLGVVGHFLNSLFRMLIGKWDFVLTFIGIYIALHMMIKRTLPYWITIKKVGITFIILAIALYNHIYFVDILQNNEQITDLNILSATWQAISEDRIGNGYVEIGGGMIGALTYTIFYFLFNELGAKIMVITLGLSGLLLTFNFSFIELIKKIKFFIKKIYVKFHKIFLKKLKNKKVKKKNSINVKEENNIKKEMNTEPIIHDFMNRNESYKEKYESKDINDKDEKNKLINNFEKTDETHDIDLKGITLDRIIEEEENYLLPPFQLLDIPENINQKGYFNNISSNSKKLESTLRSFGVGIKVIQIHRGPSVTRYEIQPDIGVKVSRIVNLADDIALALAAKDIRIEAPIPGKSAIGIEVPNTEVAIVTLREVLESQKFHECNSKISIALGRDVSGEPIIADLGKMPHLLVAGTTGSGKSVCINVIISSILFKAKPSEVKLLMIDPKVVELNVYNGIPHLLTPVVTNPKKASKALKMIVNEMEKRYEQFSEKGVKDIEKYNELIKTECLEKNTEQQTLPYIVVIIDELADLMMVAPNDVEESIIRIAQKARAAGIHLIVATQRPTVDVITGLIKANISSRIAFEVSSQIDSRTIIDINGAEKLLGRGDMLYLPVGNSKPIRIQGAYISDVEIERVIIFIKEQQYTNYQNDMTKTLEKNDEDEKEEIIDDIYEEAIKLVVESNQASVSMLQRRLRIGYNRAARLIDEMEEKGIIGPYEGTKPRKVLATKDR